MSLEAVEHLGFGFALAPIATGTASLVLIAIAYARLTGRRYPFRQCGQQNRHGTADRIAVERLGLSEAELNDILQRYRQSFTSALKIWRALSVEQSSRQQRTKTGTPTAGAIMSSNLITVKANTDLGTVADLFRRHRFTSPPNLGVRQPNAGLVGIEPRTARLRANSRRNYADGITGRPSPVVACISRIK
jgi:CBS domain-containing membrane protein